MSHGPTWDGPRPWWRAWAVFLPTRWVVGMATLGPVGLQRHAPGTWGSAAGLLLYLVVMYPQGWFLQLVWALLLAGLAIGICDEAERRLLQRDPGQIVLDEAVAIPWIFLGMGGLIMDAGGMAWLWFLAGFGLFRLFDILKPFGIARLQKLPGGLGVVADDLAAAIAANLVMRVAWSLVLL